MRPGSLADVARRSFRESDWEHHLREFLDEFYRHDGLKDHQATMIAEEPELMRDARADAFLGGAGEHLARRWRLPIPLWVRSGERYLSEGYFVPDRPGQRAFLIAVSPVAFRTRLIFTGPDPCSGPASPTVAGP